MSGIIRAGGCEAGGRAYVLISGRVSVTTVDEDQQEVVVSEPMAGEFFGFATDGSGTSDSNGTTGN